jgi:3-hydroxyanthranilate 3,4-dioxygenase
MTVEPREVMKGLEAFSLMGWIEANEHRMMPPIGNETIFKGNDNFIVMVSRGPNTRKDYHYNESEELFLQLRGDIEIGLYVDGELTSAPVKEGELFLIPSRVPHQPRRPEGTFGLIIEKHRVRTDRDGFLYFCDSCGNKLFEEYFLLEDIVKQFPMVQQHFYGSLEHRTCKRCGHVMELPPNWDQSMERRQQENEYAADAYASVHGRSW